MQKNHKLTKNTKNKTPNKQKAKHKTNKQVLPGNKRSPWFKVRLAGRDKILQTTKQKNNLMPSFQNIYTM